MTEPHLQSWWNDIHRVFMEILYRYDPLDMGSTVGAPADEYFDDATRTIRSVLDLSDEWGVSQAIASLWPGAEQAMVDELATAWRPPPQAVP